MPEVVNYTASQVNIPAALVANGLGVCLMLTVMLTKRRRVRMTTCDGKDFFMDDVLDLSDTVCAGIQQDFCWMERTLRGPGHWPYF